MTAPPPLTGVRVLEFAGLAPGPFAGLLLADNGASVLRIDRPSESSSPPPTDLLTRRKSSIAVDLKSPGGRALITKLIRHVDIVIDPFRPGVLEKVGLGPDVLLALNPRLIVGRLTGFRRDGRYKDMAGHDINYLAVSGTLSLLGGKAAKPSPPVNLLADFAGGGAMLFQAILLALLVRERSGRGQTVEANMVDGSAYLATSARLGRKTPLFDQARGENLLDGGCPWYDTYETQDGRFVAVGCLEPQFFAQMLRGLGLQGRGLEQTRYDRTTWPALRGLFEKTFKERSRDEWERVFDGTDACVTPVLELVELESSPGREGDQRPPVTLRDTTSLAIKRRSDTNSVRDVSEGQGEGVQGDGWIGIPLNSNTTGGAAGQGVHLLGEWLGWHPGTDFDVEKGGLVISGRKMTRL